MAELRGVGVSPGIGVGAARPVGGVVPEPPETASGAPGDPDAEAERALAALEAVAAELEAIGERASGPATDVLLAQAMMARDPTLAADVRAKCADGRLAARAVYEAFGKHRAALAAAGEYLAARVADLDDIRDRAVARLLGVTPPGVPRLTEPAVLIARDLAPADTALLDPALVLAFVTEEGGPTSHTAILARALGVPAVVACPGAAAIAEGALVVVDGGDGLVVVDPSEQVVAAARASARHRAEAQAASGPGRTADGHRVHLLANVGNAADAVAAVAAGAEGIGLFRTELGFLDRADAPGVEEQTGIYAAVLEPFAGHRVVARLLDAGADKPLAFLNLAAEPNPALGVRGLRALLASPDVLADQVRALTAAAERAGARLEIMAPMVADSGEAAEFATACREAGFTGPVGVMVEIPAAALRARDLLAHVDFLSLGTNDLAQYAFAADRQLGAVARLQDPWQPALLDLVAAAAAAAAAAGKPCGVCGEAAADPLLGCVLVGLGVTSLSAGAGALGAVRAALAAVSLEQCRRAAEAARAATSAPAAREAARAELPEAVAVLG